MNEDSPQIDASAPTRAQFESQRTLLHALTISVLILTGTFFIYLYRQVDSVRKNNKELSRFITNYRGSETAQAIEKVQRILDDYRKQNPEFNPIYVKYFGTNSPPLPLSAITSTNSSSATNR
ncbi:MAG TPA: hypothetical protein VF773_01355 [Verrucomicrobiae bacterium]